MFDVEKDFMLCDILIKCNSKKMCLNLMLHFNVGIQIYDFMIPFFLMFSNTFVSKLVFFLLLLI